MNQSADTNSQDRIFNQVVTLYDLTNDAVNAIGMATSLDRAHWLELARPVIETSNRSVDALCEMVTVIERGGVTLDEEKKKSMVKAFDAVFASIDQFKRAV